MSKVSYEVARKRYDAFANGTNVSENTEKQQKTTQIQHYFVDLCGI